MTKTKVILGSITLLILGFIVYKIVGAPVWEGDIVSFEEKFFNFFYQTTDFILIAISIIILSVAGGKIYPGLFLYNIGLLFTVAGDVMFAVREESEILWQGDISDLMFTIAGFFTSLGIILLVRNLNQEK
jgi:hypothetical protein